MNRNIAMINDGKSDRLQEEMILESLGESLFAANLVFHRSLNSTNILAKELALKGAPEGTVVLTEEQSAGRGRMDRRWLSPGYMNLLFSILLRPPLPVDQVFILTMILALASINGVREISGIEPMIKWPNDLYVGQRKLGGILTEFNVQGRDVEYVILGLGLNVNWNPGDQEGLHYPATNILAESGIRTPRNGLLVVILRSLERYYEDVLTGRIEDLYQRWNELSLIMGKEVEIETDKEKLTGQAVQIDRKGALVIIDSHGREQKILSGDVSLKL